MLNKTWIAFFIGLQLFAQPKTIPCTATSSMTLRPTNDHFFKFNMIRVGTYEIANPNFNHSFSAIFFDFKSMQVSRFFDGSKWYFGAEAKLESYKKAPGMFFPSTLYIAACESSLICYLPESPERDRSGYGAFNINTGKSMDTHYPRGACWVSPKGDTYLSREDGLCLLKPGGKRLMELGSLAPNLGVFSAPVGSGNGDILAIPRDRGIEVWSLKRKAPIALVGLTGKDNKWFIAKNTVDAMIKWEGYSMEHSRLIFSPSGRYLFINNIIIDVEKISILSNVPQNILNHFEGWGRNDEEIIISKSDALQLINLNDISVQALLPFPPDALPRKERENSYILGNGRSVCTYYFIDSGLVKLVRSEVRYCVSMNSLVLIGFHPIRRVAVLATRCGKERGGRRLSAGGGWVWNRG